MKILIVEDEPRARDGLAMLIQRLEPSARVRTASNGAAALEVCEQTVFDIIFTDIKMPGMSGLEMLDRLDTYCQQTVIVSGYADFSYAQTAIQHGVADYLLKPVSPARVREVLTRVSRNAHAIKQACLGGYLRDYPVLEETHRRYLRGRLDLSDPVLALWEERFPAEDADPLAGLAGEVYTFPSEGGCLWIVSGEEEEREAARARGEELGLEPRSVPLERLPELYRQQTGARLPPPQERTRDGRTVWQVKQFIRENYASDISLKALSKITYLHPDYLSKIFKRETGENISDYILNCRIEQAKRLLQDPNLKIYEVAERSGFHTSKYFAALFKAAVGLTPSQYRDGL